MITEAPSSAEPSKTTPTSAGGTAASPGDSSGAATMPTQAGTGSTSEEEKPSEEEEVSIAPEEHENMLSMSIFFIFGLLGGFHLGGGGLYFWVGCVFACACVCRRFGIIV